MSVEFQLNIESGNHQRKFITPNELVNLRKGAKKTRNSVRNELIILMLYRHGLRETELCNLKLSHLILDESKLLVTRIKNGVDSTHPIEGDELRLIKRYLNIRSESGTIGQPYLFISEQGTQLHRNTIINALKEASRLGELPHKISPHQLRHGC